MTLKTQQLNVLEQSNPVDDYSTRLQALVGRLERKEEKLSMSSFKSFCESPRHFIQYKMKEKKTTAAMMKGTLIHCLILEPEEFDERYILEPEDAPKRPSITQINAKKPSEKTLESIAFWDEFREKAKGKDVISRDDYAKAKKVADYAWTNKSIRWVLDQVTITEQHVRWDLGGYKWRGFVDGNAPSFYMDVKTMADASPKKARYAIRDMRYLWQGYLYGLAPECKGKDFYIVCLQDMPNGCVIEIESKVLQTQSEQIEFYLKKFKRCVFEGAWDAGYEYFTNNGIFSYSYL